MKKTSKSVLEFNKAILSALEFAGINIKQGKIEKKAKKLAKEVVKIMLGQEKKTTKMAQRKVKALDEVKIKKTTKGIAGKTKVITAPMAETLISYPAKIKQKATKARQASPSKKNKNIVLDKTPKPVKNALINNKAKGEVKGKQAIRKARARADESVPKTPKVLAAAIKVPVKKVRASKKANV
jgi:hypothetical protein